MKWTVSVKSLASQKFCASYVKMISWTLWSREHWGFFLMQCGALWSLWGQTCGSGLISPTRWGSELTSPHRDTTHCLCNTLHSPPLEKSGISAGVFMKGALGYFTLKLFRVNSTTVLLRSLEFYGYLPWSGPWGLSRRERTIFSLSKKISQIVFVELTELMAKAAPWAPDEMLVNSWSFPGKTPLLRCFCDRQ